MWGHPAGLPGFHHCWTRFTGEFLSSGFPHLTGGVIQTLHLQVSQTSLLALFPLMTQRERHASERYPQADGQNFLKPAHRWDSLPWLPLNVKFQLCAECGGQDSGERAPMASSPSFLQVSQSSESLSAY